LKGTSQLRDNPPLFEVLQVALLILDVVAFGLLFRTRYHIWMVDTAQSTDFQFQLWYIYTRRIL
jgi:hypothetical protein